MKRINDLTTGIKATGTRLFAECNIFEDEWDIGLSFTDPKTDDESCWKGGNWMREILVQVCAILVI